MTYRNKSNETHLNKPDTLSNRSSRIPRFKPRKLNSRILSAIGSRNSILNSNNRYTSKLFNFEIV